MLQNITMNTLNIIITVFISLLLPGRSNLTTGSSPTIRWNLVEEPQPYAIIGNLREELREATQAGGSHLPDGAIFKFLPKPNQNLSIFVLDQETGIVKTSPIRIDRETYCPSKHSACTVDISVGIVRGFQLDSVVALSINILDINDNPPKFLQHQYDVRISEAARPGYSVPLPVATDDDTPEFGVKDYRIKSTFAEFQLKVTRGSQGQPVPHLVLMSSLKMDPVPYAISLEAIDSNSGKEDENSDGNGLTINSAFGKPIKSMVGGIGGASLTGTTVILVSVEDANDHAPVFSDANINVRVREDQPLGEPLHELSATDLDHGANARISYYLSPQSELLHGNTFSVNRTNGYITLTQALDYEREKSYRLEVTAVDGGSEPMTGKQTLIINVEDVNDNAPQLSVTTVNGESQPHMVTSSDQHSLEGLDIVSQYEARVTENSKSGSFIAHLYVTDADSGKNAEVACKVTSQTDDFDLIQLVPGQYKLNTRVELDHEGNRNAYDVSIECSDGGKEPQKNRTKISVLVEDVNDNPPQFVSSSYELTVEENQPTGASLMRLRATDADSGSNAEITYSILEDVGDLISIEKRTGVIRAASLIDYEKVKSIFFTVQALDGGSPDAVESDPSGSSSKSQVIRLSSTASVTINIADVNDEEPKFPVSHYRFRLLENNQPGTLVGFVSAEDLDSNPFNSFTFDLLDYKTRGIAALFAVDPRSGKIIAKVALDRERPIYVDDHGLVQTRVLTDAEDESSNRKRSGVAQVQYEFSVVVVDDKSRSLRSEIPIQVEILDENDNPPVISHPSEPSNNTFYVSSQSPVGYIILDAEATDADAGNNAQLAYFLTSGNEAGLFAINSTSGQVSVRRDLSGIAREKHRLKLTVYDMAGMNVDLVGRDGFERAREVPEDRYAISSRDGTGLTGVSQDYIVHDTGKSVHKKLKTRSTVANETHVRDLIPENSLSLRDVALLEMLHGNFSKNSSIISDGHVDYQLDDAYYRGTLHTFNSPQLNRPNRYSKRAANNNSSLSGKHSDGVSQNSDGLTSGKVRSKERVQHSSVDFIIVIDSSIAYHYSGGISDIFKNPIGFMRDNWLLLVVTGSLLLVLVVLLCVVCLVCCRRRGQGSRQGVERAERADCLYNCRQASEEKEREVEKMSTLRGGELKCGATGGNEEGPPPGYESMRSTKSIPGGTQSGGNGSTTGTFKEPLTTKQELLLKQQQQQHRQRQQQQMNSCDISGAASNQEDMILPPPLALSTLEMKLLTELRNDPAAFGFKDDETLRDNRHHGNGIQSNANQKFNLHSAVNQYDNSHTYRSFDIHDNDDFVSNSYHGDVYRTDDNDYEFADSSTDSGFTLETDQSDLPKHQIDCGRFSSFPGASMVCSPGLVTNLPPCGNSYFQPIRVQNQSPIPKNNSSAFSFQSKHPASERVVYKPPKSPGKAPLSAVSPHSTFKGSQSRPTTPRGLHSRPSTPSNSIDVGVMGSPQHMNYEDPLQKLTSLPPLSISTSNATPIGIPEKNYHVEGFPRVRNSNFDDILNIDAQNQTTPSDFSRALVNHPSQWNNNSLLDDFLANQEVLQSNYTDYEKLKSFDSKEKPRVTSPINMASNLAGHQDSGFVTPSDKGYMLTCSGSLGQMEGVHQEGLCKINQINGVKFPAHSSALRDRLKHANHVT